MHTKNTFGLTGLYELVLVLCTLKTFNVQHKCQGPLQLLCSPFLITSTTKQMRPNRRGGGDRAGGDNWSRRAKHQTKRSPPTNQHRHMSQWKKRSERRKHCALAVVRRSQNVSPCRRPLPRSSGRPKFNQLEMVTTFTYSPSLVKIDAHNFKLSW